MPNLLKVAMIETILSLQQRGWSQRRIARELGIARETVARYLRQPPAAPKPANAPTGSEGGDRDSKPAIAPIGTASPDDGSKPAIAPIGSAPTVPSARHPPADAEHPAPGRPRDRRPRRAAHPAQPAPPPSARTAH